jgi:Icc-related predicted phosphoesterase
MADNAGVVLLNDSGCNVGGVSIWGSPITPRFLHWSFMRDPGNDIETHWNLIPVDTDVLITHGPAYGILDEVHREGGEKVHTGGPSLRKRIQIVKPRFHLFGHIHEDYGRVENEDVSHYNVSTMNNQYEISNKAVVLQLGKR